MGVLRRINQPKLNGRQRLSGARRVGPRNATALIVQVARSAHRPRTQRAGDLGAMAQDPWGIGLVRRADLSVRFLVGLRRIVWPRAGMTQ